MAEGTRPKSNDQRLIELTSQSQLSGEDVQWVLMLADSRTKKYSPEWWKLVEDEIAKKAQGGGGSSFGSIESLFPNEGERPKTDFGTWVRRLLTSIFGGSSFTPTPQLPGAIIDTTPPPLPTPSPDFPEPPQFPQGGFTPRTPDSPQGGFTPRLPDLPQEGVTAPAPTSDIFAAGKGGEEWLRNFLGRGTADEPALTSTQKLNLFRQFLETEAARIQTAGENIGFSPEQIQATQDIARSLPEYIRREMLVKFPDETWAQWLYRLYSKSAESIDWTHTEAERLVEGPSSPPEAAPHETPPPEGITRLWRIGPLPGEEREGPGVPGWLETHPRFQEAKKIRGRWFAKDPRQATWYRETWPDDPIRYIDVPSDEAERYRVVNQPREIVKESADPENEYVVPAELAQLAKNINPPPEVTPVEEGESRTAQKLREFRQELAWWQGGGAEFLAEQGYTPKQIAQQIADLKDIIRVLEEEDKPPEVTPQ